MNILLVEDDEATAGMLRVALAAENYHVDWARSGEQGAEYLDEFTYSLIILDLSLPAQSGIEMLRSLRLNHHTPVLILSALVELDAKLSSLAAGADDYLTKPFHVKELLARVGAVLRRTRTDEAERLVAGRVSLDLNRTTFEVDAEPLHVTPTEFAILEHLLRSKDRIVTKESLALSICGASEPKNFRFIEVFVSKLRQKFDEFCGGKDIIETVWGVGYIVRSSDTGLSELTA